MDSGKGRHHVLIAAAWMAGTLVSFSVMAVGARELSAHMGTFEILFFRSVVSLILLVPAVLMGKQGVRVLFTRRIGTHIARNIAHFGGQFGWVYALGLIPLAQVFALEFTLPVWTAIAATFLLGERMTWARMAAIALGLTGMLVILRPGAGGDEGGFGAGAMAALLGAMAYGLAHTLTKKMVSTEPPLSILFYMALIQLPMGLLPALAQWVAPPMVSWPWLAMMGVTALTGHYCMVRAFTLADAMVVVPLDFLRLPLIALVGMIFYAEKPSWFVFIGALLMLAGNMLSIRSEHKRKGAAEKSS